MNENEINEHWEYTLRVIKLSNGVPTLGVIEYLYKEAMKHGVKHEREKSKFDLDVMKLTVDICSICTKAKCVGNSCEQYQHFMYRDM